MTKPRLYYSVRTGKNQTSVKLDLTQLRRFVYATYSELAEKGFFQEFFGYTCVDEGFVPGVAGSDVGVFFLRRLRKDNLWPIAAHRDNYTEDDLFDIIELLYDCVSQPLEDEGFYHAFNGCGWHYRKFAKQQGREIFLDNINQVLRDYADGYRLSDSGEILSIADPGLDSLLNTPLPVVDPDNVERRVEAAISKFLRYRSSGDDRREAVRSLADVLEFLRPKLKTVLATKDEGDLFNIANNFAIRHHNADQKVQYDQSIWLTWMFYFYLSTIHASVRLLRRKEQSEE